MRRSFIMLWETGGYITTYVVRWKRKQFPIEYSQYFMRMSSSIGTLLRDEAYKDSFLRSYFRFSFLSAIFLWRSHRCYLFFYSDCPVNTIPSRIFQVNLFRNNLEINNPTSFLFCFLNYCFRLFRFLVLLCEHVIF